MEGRWIVRRAFVFAVFADFAVGAAMVGCSRPDRVAGNAARAENPVGAARFPDGTCDASRGAVVCVEPRAALVGAVALTSGGNAIDAAVATAFALAVTWPEAGNLGGGGFLLLRLADGTASFVDYREVAPARATTTMFLRPDGSVDEDAIDHSWLGVGVPGTVAGLALAHERFGKLPWRDVVLPAVYLASAGFEVSPALARSIAAASKLLAANAESARIWLRADGTPKQEGDRVELPDLARSLESIAEGGPRAFYEGEIAKRIVADSDAHGGVLALADFANYRAKIREPLRGTYRGCEILAAPPPSSGGQILLASLSQLETFDLRALELGGVDETHLIIESLRRAFLDRYRFLGDPDFVDVPIARLVSKDHARELASTIDRAQASSSRALAGDLDQTLARESEHTTHFSVVDAEGNAVANTYTLEQSWGSKITAAGTGIVMNDEMGDFNAKPGESTERGRIGTVPNVVVRGKRMLSSMCPVIVARDGELQLVAGSPGGRTIPATVLRIVTSLVDHHADTAQLQGAARVHHQLFPDVVRVERSIGEETIANLRALGHEVEPVDRIGDAHVIARIDGALRGVADRRIDGAAAAPKRE